MLKNIISLGDCITDIIQNVQREASKAEYNKLWIILEAHKFVFKLELQFFLKI